MNTLTLYSSTRYRFLRRSQARGIGFTLIEIMMVIGILALIALLNTTSSHSELNSRNSCLLPPRCERLSKLPFRRAGPLTWTH